MKNAYRLSLNIASVLAFSLAALSGTAAHAGGDLYVADPRDEIKFEAQALTKAFINTENGRLVVTPIKEEAWSSRWYLEPVGEGGYVRLKNRWTGCYLNIENGPLSCGQKEDGQWSAQWRIVHESDVKYFIINRWTSCRINKDDESLTCRQGDKTTAENLWRPANLTNLKPAVQANAPPPPPKPTTPSRAEQIAQLGTCAVSLKSTDGPFPDKMCLGAETQRANVGGNWDNDVEVISVGDEHIRVVGYENPNFTGNKVTLDCGHHELIGDPENEISSLKVIYSETPFTNVCLGSFDNPSEVTRWDF